MTAKFNSLQDSFELNNGVKIPCVGYGTWRAEDGDQAFKGVLSALEAGYRHIDTAHIYGNEKSVGDAVKQSNIARGDVFITSKLWNSVRGEEQTLRAFEASLKLLGTDYMDLYLIHWPIPKDYADSWAGANASSWRAMERLLREGAVRAIGVSNFLPHHIDKLMETAQVMPAVNQIENHIGYPQQEAVDYCRQKGILPQGWSPLIQGRLDSGALQGIAKKYGKTPAQVALRWCLDRGVLPLPKSVTPHRIKENADIFGFSLTESEIEVLANLPGCGRRGAHPDEATF